MRTFCDRSQSVLTHENPGSRFCGNESVLGEEKKGIDLFVMGSATRSLGMHVGKLLTPGLRLLPKLLCSAHGIYMCSERSITCFAGPVRET